MIYGVVAVTFPHEVNPNQTPWMTMFKNALTVDRWKRSKRYRYYRSLGVPEQRFFEVGFDGENLSVVRELT